MSSITFSIAVVSFVSLYWKISAHAVGISGTIGAILGIAIHLPEAHLLGTLAALVLLGGFLLSARLQLAAHTLSQIIAGVAVAWRLVYQSLYFYCKHRYLKVSCMR
jgi:hypothetical protein